jgi:hypothetical protein
MDQSSPAPELPEIAECDVEHADGGGYLITHRRSRETAMADAHADAAIEGMILRVSAAWKLDILPFRTRNPT